MKPPILLSLLFLALIPAPSNAQQCNLNAPAKITVHQVSACSVSFSWKKVTSAIKYKVGYRKSGTTNWQGNIKTVDTSYTFNNLDANSTYQISVQSVCSGGTVSTKSKKISFSTSLCSQPTSVIKTPIDSVTEEISATILCSFDTLYCRLGTSPSQLSTQSFSLTSEITLSNLQPNTKYYFRLSSCPLANHNFTAVDSFITVKRSPNIVLIIEDDARSDFYSCNGAPSFMQTPNIDRIANEGINFKNSFVTHSECAPSRASIATGDYTFRHGVIDNASQANLNHDLPLLPQILHDHGYNTGLVGKNHAIFSYHPGGYFDYWLEFTSQTDGYNLSYKYFNVKKTIPGYGTDVLTDTAVRFIQRAQQPFLLWLAYHAPHVPLVPANEYAHIFDSETMPLGVDTEKFTENYPSCIYNISSIQANAAKADNDFRKTYEMILSVEKGVGRVLSTLDSLGELDNTLVIFTSDNGHLLGEHYLDMKREAYEQSMRVPLFIRYPAWFAPGTIDTSNFALHIDLAPTIIQAAGIPDTFNMDGQSLKGFYDHTSSRNSFYYHYWYSTENSWYKLPAIHAVRDLSYILIDYSCQSNVVQEFFDLRNDPLEMTNQINNSAYDSLINVYRNLLQNFETQYGDTAAETIIPCDLSNPQYTREQEIIQTADFVCYPNPSSDYLTVVNTGYHDLQFVLMNELGQVERSFTIATSDQLILRDLTFGLHYLKATGAGITKTVKLVVQ